MLINCKNYLYFYLLIVPYLIHLVNCTWLRIGVSNLDLPQSDFIEQFNRQTKNQMKKMHLISNKSHEHRSNQRLINSSSKYFQNLNDTFLNNLIESKSSSEYDSILNQFNLAQLKFIKKNSNSLNIISEGTKLAIQQCALRFKHERWNCSIEDENEVFAETFKRANKESAFIQAIVSAGLTYSFTKACSTGNLANCACSYRYERYSDIELKRKQNSNQHIWNWAGCSDNLSFGIRLSRQFLDSIESKNRPASFKEQMNLHNNKAGREAITKLMRLKCRCHGSSGSCQMKTCWKVLPSFNEIGKYLKKQYRDAVRIQEMVKQGSNSKLRRIRRSTNDLSSLDLLSTKRSKASNLESHKLNSQLNQIGTEKVSSVQFSGIEINSNSFIVNNININDKTEIDKAEDYDSEDDDYFENDLEDESKKLEPNKVFKQVLNSQTVESRQIDKKTNILTGKRAERVGKLENDKKIKSKASKKSSKVSNKQQKILKINKQINDLNLLASSTDNQQVTTADPNSKLKSPSKYDLVYLNDSPNYCTANNELKILGTSKRTCRKQKNYSDTCDNLCCGRGYDRRVWKKSKTCNCSYDMFDVELKCKTCEFTYERFTCK